MCVTFDKIDRGIRRLKETRDWSRPNPLYIIVHNTPCTSKGLKREIHGTMWATAAVAAVVTTAAETAAAATTTTVMTLEPAINNTRASERIKSDQLQASAGRPTGIAITALTITSWIPGDRALIGHGCTFNYALCPNRAASLARRCAPLAATPTGCTWGNARNMPLSN